MNRKSLLLTLLLLSPISEANESTYILGVGAGVGDYGESNISRANYHVSLGYQYSESWGTELNYLAEGSELNLESYTLNLKRNFSLSKINELYLKVGVVYYDYLKESGIGGAASAGWQLKFSKCLGVYTEYSYSYLGEVDTVALNVGFTYNF
jgi:hypothetical protein